MTLTKAQIDRVRQLEDAQGRLTPNAVVHEARNKKSPLHKLFQWDKDKAAMAHWIRVAREVIGAVEIVTTNHTSTVRTVVYMRDPDAKGGQGYRSVEALRANPDQARESLRFTLEVAAGHLRRALDLAEPLGMSAEVDGLLEQITGLTRKLSKAA